MIKTTVEVEGCKPMVFLAASEKVFAAQLESSIPSMTKRALINRDLEEIKSQKCCARM